MRPGRTQTGTSSYRPPYISFVFLHETGLTMNSHGSNFVSVAGPRREILVPVCVCTCLMQMTTNLRPGTEISSLYAFRSAHILFLLTKDIISSRNEATSVSSLLHVNNCKNSIPVQVHTSLSWSQSHLNTPLI